MPISSKNCLQRSCLIGVILVVMLCLGACPGNAVTEVGLLTWKSSELDEKAIEGLEKHIRDDCSDVVLLRRDARCDEAAFRRYLREFYEREVSVMVVVGSGASLLVLAEPHPGDSPIPTVALAVSDPISLKLEGPDQDPDYPLTGVSYHLPMEKHLALLAFVFPGIRRVAFLYDRNNPAGALVEMPEIRRAGAAQGVEILPYPVGSETALDSIVLRAASEADVILLASDTLLFGNASDIVRVAGDVPVFSLSEEGVPAGAVAALYLDRQQMGHMAARQVLRILNGTPAREIPFEFPAMEKLSVNLSSARRWGIMVPRSVMERPSMVWRSSNHPAWYREDGGLKGRFQLRNDPDGRSFLRIGLVCKNALQSRRFLAGLIRGLRLGRSNYDVEAVDCADSPVPIGRAIDTYKREVDLIVVVGEAPLERVEDLELPVPVVFTGAFVSDSRVLGWRNRHLTGSTCNLAPPAQVELLKALFGEERAYLVTGYPASSGSAGEGEGVYLEMLTSGFSDVERVAVVPSLTPEKQAERLHRAILERVSHQDDPAEPPVLVVTEEGQLYHALPELGKLLSRSGLAIPVYVTSGWALQWGGTVAPDVDPEEAGLVAGRYVVRILEQGTYPWDLPVWRGDGKRGIRVNRRWKELSDWEVPPAWNGQVEEVVTEVVPCRVEGVPVQ